MLQNPFKFHFVDAVKGFLYERDICLEVNGRRHVVRESKDVSWQHRKRERKVVVMSKTLAGCPPTAWDLGEQLESYNSVQWRTVRAAYRKGRKASSVDNIILAAGLDRTNYRTANLHCANFW